MTRNAYPFGATMDKWMMDDPDIRDVWVELFNYGVATNEMKWKHNEWNEGNLNFAYADQMVCTY